MMHRFGLATQVTTAANIFAVLLAPSFTICIFKHASHLHLLRSTLACACSYTRVASQVKVLQLLTLVSERAQGLENTMVEVTAHIHVIHFATPLSMCAGRSLRSLNVVHISCMHA